MLKSNTCEAQSNHQAMQRSCNGFLTLRFCVCQMHTEFSALIILTAANYIFEDKSYISTH